MWLLTHSKNGQSQLCQLSLKKCLWLSQALFEFSLLKDILTPKEAKKL